VSNPPGTTGSLLDVGRLVLIDGSNWLFRAFYALPPLHNPQGQPTGAVYGMGNMLKKLLKDYAPKRIAVVFDVSDKSFRTDLYPEYKANRMETPEDLSSQIPAILEMIEAMGLPLLRVPDVEADDVIGTLTAQARARGEEVLIVTADKDMAQLVDERVALLDTMKNRKLDPAGVEEKFGVPPARIIDYLALMGDSSDNIPGVPGVGEKTAAKLIKEYGTLDALVERAGEVKGKLGENLRAHLPKLPLSRELTRIRCDLKLPLSLDELGVRPVDRPRLLALVQRMGFNRWAEELQSGSPLPPSEAAGSANEGSKVETPARPALPATRAEAVVTDAALDAMLEKLKAAELVCFDTETDALDSAGAGLVGMSFAIEPGHGWYIPLTHDYLGVPEQLGRDHFIAKVKPILEDPRIPKLGQHVKYDVNVLARYGIQVSGIAHDTMLQSYVLDAASNRHDMDTLSEKHLGHVTIKFGDVAGKGKHQITFNQVPIEQAAKYAAEDADVTLRLHQVLYPKVCEVAGIRRVYEEMEMPLVPVLAAMEQAGVKVDAKMLGQISTEFAQRMHELQTQAYKEAGQEFSLGSPKQLCQILYEKLQLPVLAKTPKGEPSTAEDVLEQLAAQHPLPRLILDWRTVQKLRSTYTEQLPLAINRRTGRIHTSYGQAVAATGRLSSSDPNLQNIPIRNEEGRSIRKAFVAEPGNQLLAVDYSQIELRLMAHFSEDPRLIEAFEAGRDIHQATAAEVFGLKLEEVSADQRRAAKAINFGLIYGMSSFGLAKQLGIARGEAGQYIERFFARLPGVKRFMDATREQAKSRGYVETLFGRRLYLPNINSRNAALRQYAERTAINAPLQGTAADLIKMAMIDIYAFLQTKGADVRMIMQVHDELVFEGSAAALTGLAPEIAARMCRIRPLKVPLAADYGLGTQWDQAHNASGHASSAKP
jgi:DNA polymerase I